MPSRRISDIKIKKKEPAAKRPASSASAPKPGNRSTRLRVKRRNRKLVIVGVGAFVAVVLVGGVAGLSHLPQLSITDVAVSGTKTIVPDELTAAVSASLSSDGFEFFSSKNIFLYPRAQIQQDVASTFPAIDTIEISRPGLMAQALNVSIEERSPFAKWCKAGECFVMDDEGFIYKQFENEEFASRYVFSAGLAADKDPIGQYFLRGRLVTMIGFLDALTTAGFKAEGARVESEKDFSVALEGDRTLFVPFDIEAEKAIRDLKLALEADDVRGKEGEIEYIDMRFGNRVYYKFKGEQ